MREPVVAYAEDCIVRGEVDLAEGRVSDAVNEAEFIHFENASLEALDDGRVVQVDELEVERRDLQIIEVRGHRGDAARRLRTVEERVVIEVGPFVVTGNLHRAPNAAPLAALTRWTKFVPVTDAIFALKEGGGVDRRESVILVNRERISKTEPLAYMPTPGETLQSIREAPSTS